LLAIKSFIFSRVKITTVEPIKRTTPTRRPVIKVPKVNKTFIKWPPLFNGRLPQKLVSSFKLSIYQVFFRFQGLKELLNIFPLVRSLSRASSAQAFKVSKILTGLLECNKLVSLVCSLLLVEYFACYFKNYPLIILVFILRPLSFSTSWPLKIVLVVWKRLRSS